MTDTITSSIQLAFKKEKYDLLEKIEKVFINYLEINNTNFNIKPFVRDLEFLFKLYDNYYFSGELSENLNIILKYSNKMTKTAGLVRYSKRKSDIKIVFSYPLIFQSYLKKPEGYIVNGIFCKNPVESLMRVLEHELSHLVEYILFGSTNCNKPQFIKIAYELFGHTENKHKIGLKIHDYGNIKQIKKGDKVSFPYRGKIYSGSVLGIRKNITVAIKELNNIKKFYVPFSMIIKEENK